MKKLSDIMPDWPKHQINEGFLEDRPDFCLGYNQCEVDANLPLDEVLEHMPIKFNEGYLIHLIEKFEGKHPSYPHGVHFEEYKHLAEAIAQNIKQIIKVKK